MDDIKKIERKRGPKQASQDECNGLILKQNNTFWSNFKDHMLTEFEQNPEDWEADSITTKKYLAAICLLTRVNLKDIAAYVGASYGTVRNWSSHAEFRELVDALAEDFAAYILTALGQEFDNYMDQLQDTDDIVVWSPAIHAISRQNNIWCYSDFVLNYVYQTIRANSDDIMSGDETYHLHGFLMNIFADILYTYDELKEPIYDIRDILDSDDPISEADRRAMIKMLDILQGKLRG
jgi:hypothetical protein